MDVLRLFCIGNLMCFGMGLSVWEEPLNMSSNLPKPTSWDEKNYGQICRNFTLNQHVQCPEGSFIHWYVCCGENNTDCCFGVQPWALVCFGFLAIVGLLVLVYSILLHFNIICSSGEEEMDSLTREKSIES